MEGEYSEGLIVFFITIILFSVVIIYLYYGSGSKSCPKCQGIMFKEIIDGERVWVCKKCGNIQRKNWKIIFKKAFEKNKKTIL